jgi:P27 family predicted phage terminase small subunit
MKPEPLPFVPEDCPPAPDYFEGYAHDEWYRIGPELHRLGLFTIVDLSVFAAYCQAYGTWRTAVEAIAQMAKQDGVTKGLMLKGKGGGVIANPLVLTARQAGNDMVRYAGEFGMSPAARRRLSSEAYQYGKPTKFAGLLAN